MERKSTSKKMADTSDSKWREVMKKYSDARNLARDYLESQSDETFIGNYLLPEECLHGYKFSNKLGSGVNGTTYTACAAVKDDDKSENCGYAVKTYILHNARDRLDWTKESKFAKLAGDYGIGPKVYDSWMCPDAFGVVIWRSDEDSFGGDEDPEYLVYNEEKKYFHSVVVAMIVSDKLDLSFVKWLKNLEIKTEYDQKNVIEMLANIQAKLYKLHEVTKGYLPFDFDPYNNAMIKLNSPTNGGKDEFFIIDFGMEGMRKIPNEELDKVIGKIMREFERAFAEGVDSEF